MATAAAATIAANLVVICCNGGLPYVDLHLWPHDETDFRSLDLTDWVATDRNVADWITEDANNQSGNALTLPEWLQLPIAEDFRYCDVYNLTFSTQSLQQLYNDRNGTLACDCPLGTLGESCEIRASELSDSNNYSQSIGNTNDHTNWAMFALVVIVPVCFVLFAVLGALTCRFFLVDFPHCYDYLWVRRRKRNGQNGDGSANHNTSENAAQQLNNANNNNGEDLMDQHLLTDLLEKAERYKHRQRHGDCSGGAANPVEMTEFLPTVSGNVPHYNPTAPPFRDASPPPSYKSVEGSPTTNQTHDFPPLLAQQEQE